MKEFDFAERDLVAAHKVEPSNRYSTNCNCNRYLENEVIIVILLRAVSEALGQVKLRKKREQASMQAKMSKMFS